MYLNKDGKLVHMPNEETLFSIEFHKGCVAFKHKNNGRYLTAVGPQGILTARSKCVTKDELFTFDANHAQVSLIAHNGKLVSVKQGVDVSANQVEINDTETFQLEEEDVNEKWTLRTNTNKYWKLEASNGIQSTGDSKYNIITSILLCVIYYFNFNYFM
jgi:fascin 1